MFERILVATDGSELSERGVDAAIELAKKTGGEVFFVTVTSLMPSYSMTVGAEWAASPGTFDDYRQEMENGAQTILKAAMKRAEAAGVKAHGFHRESQVAATGICHAAEEYKADIIVIASHGRRGVHKLLLGSQTSEVMRLTDLPVLIVK